MKLLICIIGVLLFSSCLNESTDLDERNSEKVLKYNFDLAGKYKSTDTLYFEKRCRSDSVDYIYWVDNHRDSMWYRYYVKTVKDVDTIVFYHELACPLEETKFYKYKGKVFPVDKYYYDDINSEDEESIVYFNDSLGILLIYSTGWSYMEAVFNYNNSTDQIINSIINDTTNDFPLFDRDNYNKLTLR